jgi:GntR family transcriptional regulator/MocR family aminotransferase
MDRFRGVYCIKASKVSFESDVPLHRQLMAIFRDAIVTGTLQPGERVPSSRELGAHFGISRNTALNALSQLQAEGYLVTVQGSGTFVADVPAKTEVCDERHASGESAAAAVPFRPGAPDLNCFPAAAFKRGLSTLEWTPELLDDASSSINDRLSTAIAQRLQQTRGVVCSPDQILIVPSTLYAISLIGRTLLSAGDEIVMEDPGCPNIRSAFGAIGARIVPVPVDNEGIEVDSFVHRRSALAYVTPSHQYPTGAPLSQERRFALLEWASQHGGWIVENDYYAEFNYARRPQPSLQGLDEGRHVLYVGSFSKALSRSIRIAYVIAPRALCAALKAAHQATAGYASPILQAAVAAFMERGHFARHVARMRSIYDERRRFLSSTLCNAGFQVCDWGAGLHFTADIPNQLPDYEVSERALEQGIDVPPLSRYFHGPSTMNGLVFGFAASPIPTAKIAVKSLLKAL